MIICQLQEYSRCLSLWNNSFKIMQKCRKLPQIQCELQISRSHIQIIHQLNPHTTIFGVSCLCCAVYPTLLFCGGDMDLLLKTACSFEKISGDWAEIVHVGEVLFRGEKGVFRSHWVAGIDRQPYKPPAHILSSIRALKVLLTAHLSIMKTYSRWMWMPSYFQPSHKSSTSVAAPCRVMMLSSSPDQWWPEPAIDLSGWGSGTWPVPVLTHGGQPGHTGHSHSLDWCRQRLICTG